MSLSSEILSVMFRSHDREVDRQIQLSNQLEKNKEILDKYKKEVLTNEKESRTQGEAEPGGL